MSTPIIEDLLIDDRNEAKINDHGLSVRQIVQILGNEHMILRNRRRRRTAMYLVIGRDDSGVCITVPVEKTTEPGVWRPVTAWPCKVAERGWLDRQRG